MSTRIQIKTIQKYGKNISVTEWRQFHYRISFEVGRYRFNALADFETACAYALECLEGDEMIEALAQDFSNL